MEGGENSDTQREKDLNICNKIELGREKSKQTPAEKKDREREREGE